MARSNTAKTRTAFPSAISPIATEAIPSGQTALGHPGYKRNSRSELDALAVSLFAGEDAFHETANARKGRFIALVRQLAVTDAEWCGGYLVYLRGALNIRIATIEGAAEFVKARIDAGLHGLSRQVVAGVLQRADEPTEILAYWTLHYGRRLPKPLKRGVADACRRLYSERSLLKHDVPDRAWRMADVIELVHPRPWFDITRLPTRNLEGMSEDEVDEFHDRYRGEKLAQHSALFRHMIDLRHGRGQTPPMDTGRTLWVRHELMRMPVRRRREWLCTATEAGTVGDWLRSAGMTWEALAGWLQGPMDQVAWEAIIPAMGYGALLKNLRNFDKAGVSDTVARQVADRLADPEQVSWSRQFPFRFLAAHRATEGSLRWGWALEQALTHSLSHVPRLDGRTLVLVDRSPSMWMQKMSKHSDMDWADGAAVFGAAVALRAAHADLVEFGATSRPVPIREGQSVLKLVERFGRISGTDIPAALTAHLRPHHTRVVIITDEQTQPGYLPYLARDRWGRWQHRQRAIDDVVPQHVPVYMWNFGGYEHGAVPTGHTNRHSNRHCLAGLTDSAFRIIPMLEAGHNADWPFEPMTAVA